MNHYLFSTSPMFSQQEDTSTMKKVSSSILPGENTDANISMSIFNLPKENIEKLEEQVRKTE